MGFHFIGKYTTLVCPETFYSQKIVERANENNKPRAHTHTHKIILEKNKTSVDRLTLRRLTNFHSVHVVACMAGTRKGPGKGHSHEEITANAKRAPGESARPNPLPVRCPRARALLSCRLVMLVTHRGTLHGGHILSHISVLYILYKRCEIISYCISCNFNSHGCCLCKQIDFAELYRCKLPISPLLKTLWRRQFLPDLLYPDSRPDSPWVRSPRIGWVKVLTAPHGLLVLRRCHVTIFPRKM